MKNLIYICFLLLLFSCEDVPTSDTTNTTSITKPSEDNHSSTTEQTNVPNQMEETISRKPISVENIYATSTAPKSDVYNLFDFNEQTVWQTKVGSGPDEGILLEFRKDQLNYVSSIELGGVKSANLAEVRLVMLYLNGQPNSFKTGKLGEKIVIDTELKSLYIRIFNTHQDKTTEKEENYATVSLHQFPKTASVALHSLNIYGKEENAYRVVLPQILKGKVTTTSTLAPDVAYDVSHLFDGKLNTAWVEGEKDLGLGQSILLEFPQQVVIDKLQIWNGYQRSPHHFKTNSSLKDFSFGLPVAPKTYTLRDTPAGQSIKLSSKILSNQFQFRIIGGYQGSKYSDLAISEMVLYNDDDKAMIVQTNAAEKFRQFYQNKAKNTPLAEVLNRRIFNTFNFKYEPLVSEHSIILHDDGTFVFYSKELNTENETVKEINTTADGNWVILESQADQVKIRIFGSFKTYNPVELRAANKKPEDYASLFKDVLTITKGQMEGTDIIQRLFW